MSKKKINICVIGLGYVGLPLSIEFSKHFNTIGYDHNLERIKSLKNNLDYTNEVSKQVLKSSNIIFTNKIEELKSSNIYIVCVPTPVNKKKLPDLSNMINATKQIGNFLTNKDLVIYESTVYPGVTDEVCIPILERYSNLKCCKNNNNIKIKYGYFYCGYSPERINPGDKQKRLDNINKLVAGSCDFATDKMKFIYSKIIKAKVVKTKSIKIAESAKIIENIQRDVNIALMNEFSIIFNKLNINSNEVFEAAKTKWNFLDFSPGLVGGHCIGVDPYYLAYKAKTKKINPKMILSGRETNNYIPLFIKKNLIKIMNKKFISINKSKILILGFTFKENCNDFRNTLVYDLYKYINKVNKNVTIMDPLVDINKVKKVYKNIPIINKIESNCCYDVIILAVSHNLFKQYKTNKILKLCKKNKIIMDLKNFLPSKMVDFSL